MFNKTFGKTLCAKTNEFDAEAMYRDKRIVLVDLSNYSTSKEITSIFGTIFITKTYSAALKQVDTPREERDRVVVLADEAQRFVHRASGIEDMLSEGRKFGITFVGANQFSHQIPKPVMKAIDGNIGFFVSFAIGLEDAKVIAKYFDGTTESDFINQEVGHCHVRFGSSRAKLKALEPISFRFKKAKRKPGRVNAMVRRWLRSAPTRKATEPNHEVTKEQTETKPLAWMN